LEAVIASLMGLLAWLPIEDRTAFPVLLRLLWLFRCWLQNHNRSFKLIKHWRLLAFLAIVWLVRTSYTGC